MTPKKSKESISNEEAIKNLLIILSLLKDGVDSKLIEKATLIPEMTIRWKFPMKYLMKSRKERNE
jgi:hypothetical protein